LQKSINEPMKRLIILAAMMLTTLSLGLNAQTPEEEELDRKYAATLLQPGTDAPDFVLNDLAGKPVRLSDFRGKTVVLVFWASWCPDCRAEVPQLKEIYAAADPAKVRFVSVSFDREFDTLKQFVAENKLPGVQLFDPAGKKDSAVGSAYGVQWIPSLYLINPDGKVAVSTVIAGKIAAALTGKAASGLLPKDLCTDESCAL
jgi:peroxiredoxin